MKNILVVGGGGREHAIIMKLAESPKVGTVSYTHLTLPTTVLV